jgi:hypothetical protein
MRLVIDNTTRFFAVVGAPYVPERHAESDVDGVSFQRTKHDLPAAASASRLTGSWLNDDR